LIDVSEVVTASVITANIDFTFIAMLVKAVITPETSKNFYQAARFSISQESHLQQISSKSVLPY
jgi:hypothetical protein